MARRASKRRPWRLTEDEPERFVALPFRDGIRRIVAPNPSAMTYHGTNTWLVDWDGGTVVIDPGTEDERHLEALMREAGSRLSHIIVTHFHHDHVAGAATLSARAGVPIASFHAYGGDDDFKSDIALSEGDKLAGFEILHTPGHASDHICLALGDILFAGDHVMGWSTSVVPPHPAGDLGAFVRNLERVRDRDDAVILSAHGPAIIEPRSLVQSLLDHRAAREESIVALIGPEPQSFDALFSRAYLNLRSDLVRPARYNLQAHLEKLLNDGRIFETDDGWKVA